MPQLVYHNGRCALRERQENPSVSSLPALLTTRSRARKSMHNAAYTTQYTTCVQPPCRQQHAYVCWRRWRLAWLASSQAHAIARPAWATTYSIQANLYMATLFPTMQFEYRRADRPPSCIFTHVGTARHNRARGRAAAAATAVAGCQNFGSGTADVVNPGTVKSGTSRSRQRAHPHR